MEGTTSFDKLLSMLYIHSTLILTLKLTHEIFNVLPIECIRIDTLLRMQVELVSQAYAIGTELKVLVSVLVFRCILPVTRKLGPKIGV